ncbi:MAG: glycosyltransferase family 4 protein, partial [Phormidesmis sp. CAN_BIN36]|nr:glycosyltransferase family 4 protein [Phormidesmis sp. CAN_BIN36]
VLSCNSESTKLYQELYPAFSGRFSYYRNSVDNETFYPLPVAECDDHRQAFAKELGLSAETRFMIFAGRLHPQKDPLLLVRSLAALKEPKIHLLIAGQGELAEAVRVEAAQLGVSKQVTMLGAVKPPKLAELHRLSSLCVLTSAYEGLPLVVLEALACGTPIVTTRAGDTPNVLTEQSGLVCEERTPTSVAEALRKVLDNPDYFSPQACIQAAMPYGAKHVLHGIYDAMLQRWQNGS